MNKNEILLGGEGSKGKPPKKKEKISQQVWTTGCLKKTPPKDKLITSLWGVFFETPGMGESANFGVWTSKKCF